MRLRDGPAQPADRRVQAPAAGVVVGQVRVEASASLTVEAVAAAADGTIDESTGLGDTRLYRDVDGDGALGPNDLPLGTGQAVSRDNGMVTFRGLGLRVDPAAPVDLLLATEVRGAARVGDTVSFRVEGWRAEARDPSGQLVRGEAGAELGAARVVGGDPPRDLSVSLAPTSPSSPLSVAADARDVPAVALRFESALGGLDLQGLTFALRGSGDDARDLLEARLVLDANRNGAIDAGERVLARGVPDADDGRLAFAFGGQRLAAGGSLDLVVGLRLAGTAAAGAKFSLALDAAGVTAHNHTGNGGVSVRLAATPLRGATLRVGRTADALLARAAGDPARIAGAGEHLSLALTLRAGGAPAQVDALTVHARGDLDDAREVGGVSLYDDADGDGRFVPGSDALLSGPARFARDDGQVHFALASPLDVPAGTARTLLVVVEFPAGLAPGKGFALVVDPAAGDLSTNATVAPVPLQVGTLLVTGSGRTALVQPDPALGKDAYVRGEGLYLNDNFGRHGLAVGDRPSGQLGERQSYIELPLPALPAGATPARAYLALYVTGTGGLTGPFLDVQAHRVIDSPGGRTPWIEGRGGFDASADGICYDGTIQGTGRPELSRPDVDPTALDEVRVAAGSEGNWVLFDVTAAVRRWANGSAPNFGLRLRDKDFATHDDGAVSFASSDDPWARRRPILIVEH
ncbi:MAG: DNRLRE domain-containing protein [Planctomycetota bacterium]|nr:MAG: DNRLRE domain-containing protein [Planctomycetota bacterium]